jgi:hypothetical protein
MEILFNPRDNGAGPLCSKIQVCIVRGALAGSVAVISDRHVNGLELVVYSCPQFKEK